MLKQHTGTLPINKHKVCWRLVDHREEGCDPWEKSTSHNHPLIRTCYITVSGNFATDVCRHIDVMEILRLGTNGSIGLLAFIVYIPMVRVVSVTQMSGRYDPQHLYVD